MRFIHKELFPRDHHHLPIFLSFLALLIVLPVVLISSQDRTTITSGAAPIQKCIPVPPCPKGVICPKPPGGYTYCISQKTINCGVIRLDKGFPNAANLQNIHAMSCFWQGIEDCALGAQQKNTVVMVNNYQANGSVTKQVFRTKNMFGQCSIAVGGSIFSVPNSKLTPPPGCYYGCVTPSCAPGVMCQQKCQQKLICASPTGPPLKFIPPPTYNPTPAPWQLTTAPTP